LNLCSSPPVAEVNPGLMARCEEKSRSPQEVARAKWRKENAAREAALRARMFAPPAYTSTQPSPTLSQPRARRQLRRGTSAKAACGWTIRRLLKVSHRPRANACTEGWPAGKPTPAATRQSQPEASRLSKTGRWNCRRLCLRALAQPILDSAASTRRSCRNDRGTWVHRERAGNHAEIADAA
jgi:hypothetical protein